MSWTTGSAVVTATTLALSPATITVTGIAQDISVAQPGAPPISPAIITVTPQALGVTVGAVSLALAPATVTVTAQSLTLTGEGIEPAAEAEELVGGGKWDVTEGERRALRERREREVLMYDDDDVIVLL